MEYKCKYCKSKEIKNSGPDFNSKNIYQGQKFSCLDCGKDFVVKIETIKKKCK